MTKHQFGREVTKLAHFKNLSKANSALDNYIFGLLEVPDFGYLLPECRDLNSICMINKETLEPVCYYALPNKEEIATSIECFEKRVTLDQRAGKQAPLLPFVVVGTTHINPNEFHPQEGRILILEVELTPKPRFVLRHIEKVDGAAQAALPLYDDARYLLAGINNAIKLYKFEAKQGPSFVLTLVESCERGNCITDIKASEDWSTIFVGDMMRSVAVLDLKEIQRGLQTQIRLSISACSSHHIWVNSLLPLSNEQTLVFDKERNAFILERCHSQANDQQRVKMKIVGGMRHSEQITRAVKGNLSMIKDTDPSSSEQDHEDFLAKQYLQEDKKQVTEERKAEEPDLIMIDTEAKKDESAMKTAEATVLACTSMHARDMLIAALNDIKVLSKQHIIFGTSNGSVGQMTRITPPIYSFLIRL